MIELSPSLGLGPPSGQREKLAEAATQFEAVFLRQVLASARQAGLGDDLFGSAAGDTFRQMMDDRFADLLAGTGIVGLGKSIEAQLAQRIGPVAEG